MNVSIHLTFIVFQRIIRKPKEKGLWIMKKIISLVLVMLTVLSCLPVLASSGTVKAVSGDTYVRYGAGKNYRILGTLYKGNTLEFGDRTATDNRGVEWYRVYYKGQPGWVSSMYTTLNGQSKTSYVVATGDVYLRKGAGINYAQVGMMKKGQTLPYLNSYHYDNRDVVWYKVTTSTGKEAWVSSKYSKLSSSPSPAPAPSGNYVEAVSGDTYLRNEPSINSSKKLETIHKGETAVYLGEHAVDNRGVTWYYVNFGGLTGWVSSRYVKMR